LNARPQAQVEVLTAGQYAARAKSVKGRKEWISPADRAVRRLCMGVGAAFTKDMDMPVRSATAKVESVGANISR
jgi:hypothetical protein